MTEYERYTAYCGDGETRILISNIIKINYIQYF